MRVIVDYDACQCMAMCAVAAPDARFDIGPGHSAPTPVLRRLKSPDIRHPAYWAFARQ